MVFSKPFEGLFMAYCLDLLGLRRAILGLLWALFPLLCERLRLLLRLDLLPAISGTRGSAPSCAEWCLWARPARDAFLRGKILPAFLKEERLQQSEYT